MTLAKSSPASETSNVEVANLVTRAETNLERQLEWVGRFDAKSSIVIGIVVGMMGFLATILPPVANWTCPLKGTLAIAVLLLAGSMVALFLGQLPNVKAPNTSLLFFGTIATMPLHTYVQKHKTTLDVEYLDDLLTQIHVNSQILSRKFATLKWALILLLGSSVPWAFAIYASRSITNAAP